MSMDACSSYIRIKINICDNNSTTNKNVTRFWYYLNSSLLVTIEQVENDLKRILIEKFNYLNLNATKQLGLYVDEFMLPRWEISSIIRDNDLIK